MDAHDVILGSRVAHVRELKAELQRVKAENVRLREENAQLRGHFDMALLAACDLRGMRDGGRFIIVDGWNAILGAVKTARDPKALIQRYEEHLAANPLDFVWIVFDGHRENSRESARLRVSYTGGEGLHRADRFICDFLRMAKFGGRLDCVDVVTSDKDFLRDVKRIFSGGLSKC